MKIFRTMLCLLIAISMMNAVPADAATWEDATGPYSTTVVSDTGPDNKYYIFRPTTLKLNTHPIVVFSVGAGSHPKNYAALLTQLASHGVVIIAGTDPYQEDGSQASAGIDWLIGQNEIKKSEYYQKLVPSKVLAIGHSKGGNGVMSASIKNSKITSLLLYAPAVDTASSSDLLVPTFYISGSLDQTVPPNFIKAKYREQQRRMHGMERILINVILGSGAIYLFNTTRGHGYTPIFSTIQGPQEDASTDQIGHLKMHQPGKKH